VNGPAAFSDFDDGMFRFLIAGMPSYRKRLGSGLSQTIANLSLVRSRLGQLYASGKY
jgi:hypothetical protein